MFYNPANWYWIVGDNATQVWSSARVAYVPATDATYAAWLLAGGLPTRILSEAELQAVLTGQYPPGWPPTLAQKAMALLAAGLTITSPAIGLTSVAFAADADTQAHVNAEVTSILLNGTFADGTATVMWADMTGTAHAIPSVAAFKPFASAIAAFVAGVMKCILGISTTLPASVVVIA